jgi:ribose transport system substrate-binding protein
VVKKSVWLALCLVTALSVGCGSSGDGGGSTGGSGTTSRGSGAGITRADLAPFRASDTVGEKPDLPGTVAFVQDNPRGYEQSIATGLKAGAEDAGLKFVVAQSGGDPQKHIQDMQQFLITGVNTLVTLLVDPTAQAPVMIDAMRRGVNVNAVVFGPATSQANASQYEGGEVMGNLAKDYIESRLGGRANVVILNMDTIEAVRPRFQAIRDVLRTVPGAKIVADQQPDDITSDQAFRTMTTILQKEPNVDVVLGVDATSTGALAALRSAGKDRPDQFIGGFDGEPQALDEIARGGPYKATITTEPSIMGYAWGRFAGDWAAGKRVPQGICVLPKALTNAAEVDQYRTDEANPAPVFEDPERIKEYLSFWGDISYETRDRFIADAWTPKSC